MTYSSKRIFELQHCSAEIIMLSCLINTICNNCLIKIKCERKLFQLFLLNSHGLHAPSYMCILYIGL